MCVEVLGNILMYCFKTLTKGSPKKVCDCHTVVAVSKSFKICFNKVVGCCLNYIMAIVLGGRNSLLLVNSCSSLMCSIIVVESCRLEIE